MGLPLILDVKALVKAVGTGFVPHAIFPSVVPIGTSRGRNISWVRRVSPLEFFTPIDVKPAIRIVIFQTVGDTIFCIAALNNVLLSGNTGNV